MYVEPLVTENARKQRVFSGIQPSGKIHIGNYLGALRRWVAEQHHKENYFCIVDLHAITVPQDPISLRRATRELVAVYLAVGLDPQVSTIFIQSHVPAHAVCGWVLSCVTPIGWLERMTQFKTKSRQGESVNAGLLIYPVLQAADILLYDADEVPVGEDQAQHVELARDIAQRFNFLYGDTFVIPRLVLPDVGGRIRALNDPQRKMSKSETHIRGHAIGLVDDPDEIRSVLRQAVTDAGREIVFSQEESKAGVNNLLEIYKLLTEQSQEAIEAHFSGKGYSALKAEVAEVVIEALRPIRIRYQQLVSDPAELDRLLAIGAERAMGVAEPKMTEIKLKAGFVIPGG